MKRIYIDFEMNMPNNKTKRDTSKADLIAIGAIKYDTKTGKIDKFKSLIKPVSDIEIYPHIQELTKIDPTDLNQAPSYEEVMRKFKLWLGIFSEIEGIYTFGNLDVTCFNNTDKKSSLKYNHPRFINNIRDLFVDIKDKYLGYGLKCMNYISLKNLLHCANVEFSGEAHDPLYDAYNLFVLDSILEKDEGVRDILIIQDIMRPPFTIINNNLEEQFERYKKYFYDNKGSYNINLLSDEIIKTINQYIISLKDMDIHNLDTLRDIGKKLDTIDKIKDIKEGYFYILENLYFDMKDLLADLMLYKLDKEEYKDEIDNIVELFENDLIKDNIKIQDTIVQSY
ncbi:exonuclease [Romboutsia weinsteinii]|uniref:Exonuclease n=1 Tax=Romboutsia weinsteinii TaxID=2020949 RepID=A0A371JAJ8_9FIRM|nr:3'-5' exonuclease [Romboutsia weinsteinii]RDY29782.1 exonuclease [Romboutsia weinsteinii]